MIPVLLPFPHPGPLTEFPCTRSSIMSLALSWASRLPKTSTSASCAPRFIYHTSFKQYLLKYHVKENCPLLICVVLSPYALLFSENKRWILKNVLRMKVKDNSLKAAFQKILWIWLYYWNYPMKTKTGSELSWITTLLSFVELLIK